jgi:hypothetical protein
MDDDAFYFDTAIDETMEGISKITRWTVTLPDSEATSETRL